MSSTHLDFVAYLPFYKTQDKLKNGGVLMKSLKNIKLLALFFIVGSITFFSSIASSSDVKKISKEDLKNIMDNSDVSIVDVRRGKDWSASEFKIKQAVRVDPNKFEEWANSFSKDKTLVLYCA